MQPTIAMICRYPVKGLSPERLTRVVLSPGECLPQDRRFAIARSDTRFDPDHPKWLPKTSFLMLMRENRLAQLETRFDENSGHLTVERSGQMLVRAQITEPEGRRLVSDFFAEFMRDHISGPPQLIEAPGHTFSDAKRRPNASTYKYVSLVNLASISALESVANNPVDPIRFRVNLYLDGATAWSELGWLGSTISVGIARLRVISAITRCAATHVNPRTGERDLDVLGALRRGFGHINMGIYAEVIGGGEIIEGDAVTLG